MSDRIVVGVDRSPSSMEALQWAFDEARRRGATLEVVHAWTMPTFDGFLGSPADVTAFEEAAQAALNSCVATLPDDPQGPDVVSRLVRGSAVQALLDAAIGADMVVVGSHGRSAGSELLLGSVSHHVVNRAPCPVVVVRKVVAAGPQIERTH